MGFWNEYPWRNKMNFNFFIDETVRMIIREKKGFIILVGNIHFTSKNNVTFKERNNEIEWLIKKTDIISCCKHQE